MQVVLSGFYVYSSKNLHFSGMSESVFTNENYNIKDPIYSEVYIPLTYGL